MSERNPESRSNRPMRRLTTRPIAWIASATSIALAGWPGVDSLVRGSFGNYDASLALLTATLIGLIWYTQFTFETLQHVRSRDERERERSRVVLATGLLAELEWIEVILEKVYRDGPYSSYDSLEHPLFETALTQSSLFNTETMVQLAKFHAILRDLRAGVNAFRSNADIFGEKGTPDWLEAKRNFRFAMAEKAYRTLTAVSPLAHALVREGGVLPQREALPQLDRTPLPKLPPSPFETGRMR